MTRRVRWVVGALALLVVVALLAVFGSRAVANRRAQGGAAAAASAASGAAQAIDLAPGDVATAQRSELVALLPISGGLRAVDSAVVKARVAAEVAQLLVREGDAVAAGQLVGRLDDTEYKLRLQQAEEQAAAAQSQLDIAQRALDNNKALVDQGFISKNALDTSVSSAGGAAASLRAARVAADIAKKAVRDSEIRAPLAGLVSQRLVQPGERVSIDARLLEIVDLSRIELEAAVAPEDVLGVRVGAKAAVQVDGLAAPLSARVVRINPGAQSGTRAVMAYLRIDPGPAAAGLRQGLFARASIEIDRRTALVVPASAVRFDQATPYVMAWAGDAANRVGRAVRRPVTLGVRGNAPFGGRSEAAVEVTSGVEAGATVLRGTVGALRDGTPLRLPAAAASASTAAGAAALPSASASAPAPAPAAAASAVAAR